MLVSCHTHPMETQIPLIMLQACCIMCVNTCICTAICKRMNARKIGALELFTAEVQTRHMLMGVWEYDSAEKTGRKIKYIAEELLPCVKPRRKPRFRDDLLSSRVVCVELCCPQRYWRDTGSLSEKSLSEEKNRL